ncbi:hypothetical protein GCM10020369_67130 [Cryptosporangium minutisporangium]|uniref:Response regulatory domain-containing protein n=1 Tax=Cryptosporangium minutisporangium TaxID=113569 RepID=A0ABP6T8X3_9ACTN
MDQPSAPTGHRVLVVDDDPTVSEVVSRYLERAGFAVARAGEAQPRSASRPSSNRTWWSST